MELKCAHQRFGASLHMEICFRFVPEKAECSVAPGGGHHHTTVPSWEKWMEMALRWLIRIEKFRAPGRSDIEAVERVLMNWPFR